MWEVFRVCSNSYSFSYGKSIFLSQCHSLDGLGQLYFVIAVGTDPKIDFVLGRVSIEGHSYTEDRIRRRHDDVGKS